MVETDDTQVESVCGTYGLLFLVSLVFLCLLPYQAAWVTTDRGWYTQPVLGPALGLGILAIFSLVRIAQAFKHRRGSASGSAGNVIEMLFDRLENYRTALMSSLLFFLYVRSLSLFGFLLSTVLFISTLLWLCRLFDRTWFFANLLTVAALVIIFRIILHIWFPDAWLYSLLPDNLADLANQYL